MAETATLASSDALPLQGIPHKSSDAQGLHVRRKKPSDPFFTLDDHLEKPLDLQAASSETTAGQEDQADSLLKDLIVTPLNVITFILSLSMVDYRQRQWRLSQHSPVPDTFWYRVTNWSWLQPEPYQDYRDGTWKHNRNVADQNAHAPDATFSGWSTQKRHRKVAKMAISDAFDLRGRVAVAILVWSTIAALGAVYAASRLYGWILSR